MPFTVSHIAAVLPAHRWFTRANVFSAAVIGSMSAGDPKVRVD